MTSIPFFPVAVLLLALGAGRESAQAGAVPPVRNGHFRTSDGVRLRYLEAGAGPPILFVPGWTMTAPIWDAQIRTFARSHHVIALDPRSQGGSEKPPEGHTPERRGRDIKELVDHLRLAPVTIVAWSMAVQEMLAYVDQFGAGDLRGLVLVDGFVKFDPAAVPAVAGTVRALRDDRRAYTDRFVRSMYRKPHAEAYLAGVVSESLKTPTGSAAALMSNSVARLDWTGALARLGSAPLLFVCEPQLERQAELVRREVPSARVEVFEDAGHALFVDDADRFNSLLQDFEARIGPK